MPTVKVDAVLAEAADLARAQVLEGAEPGSVGAHRGVAMLGDRLAAHRFECTAPAYPGWEWTVTLARAPRAKVATVCEVSLGPADGALLPPDWLPYADRLAPGDIGAGDVTPYLADDPLLEPGFEATGDEDVDALAFWELGLGRERVLSREGRSVAAQRWYDGGHGPHAPVAVKAPAPCATCGFYVQLAGALRSVFGVCANEWSPSDGTVVSYDHGCGAHSQVDAEVPEPVRVPGPLVDEITLDEL